MEKTKLNFEEKLSRLDVIVKTMETKTLSLDESIALFDEGIAIIKLLEGALSEAEAKVAVIIGSDKVTSAKE
ncbi:MAG: exodeoxyribonuclease VII small subunit [Firmicutes bacterium]|nr:exodeoxyribonuclease VII small subunit [Bacillota bacterium]